MKILLIFMLVLLSGCASHEIINNYHPIGETKVGYKDTFLSVGQEFEVNAQSFMSAANTEMLALYRVRKICNNSFMVHDIESGFIVQVHNKDERLISYSNLKASCF